MAFNGFSGISAKSEFQSLIWQLPEQVQQDLKDHKLQLVRDVIYGVKEIRPTSDSVKIFESGDRTARSLCNIVQGRLEADTHYMVMGIRTRTAQFLTADDGKSIEELASKAIWTKPAANVANGEFTFGSGATTYMDKMATSVFDHNGTTELKEGEYRIDGKVLKPQTELKVDFDLVQAPFTNSATRMLVRVDMEVLKTVKA